MSTNLYGTEVGSNEIVPARPPTLGVIQVDPEPTIARNIIIAAGRAHAGGWTKSEHIVLTPAETILLLIDLADAYKASVGHPLTLLALTEQEKDTVTEAVVLYAESFGQIEQTPPPEVAGLLAKLGVE